MTSRTSNDTSSAGDLDAFPWFVESWQNPMASPDAEPTRETAELLEVACAVAPDLNWRFRARSVAAWVVPGVVPVQVEAVDMVRFTVRIRGVSRRHTGPGWVVRCGCAHQSCHRLVDVAEALEQLITAMERP